MKGKPADISIQLKTVFELLDHERFRKRPVMYLGDKKISTLKAFLDGYFYAENLNSIKDKSNVRFEEFHSWVADFFEWKGTSAGWKDIILQECDGNEEQAFDKFLEVYDKFKLR